MNKVNFQKQLDAIIDECKKEGKTPKLLLHACCAPCSSYCLEYLSQHFDITVFYYNPNIFPEDEYHHRVDELRRLISELQVKNEVHFIEGKFDPEEFFSAVRGLENEPEGGERCKVCFRLRLEETAKLAREKGFDYFTTTLTISPLKDAQVINAIASELSGIYSVGSLPSDFKKREGYKRSIELSKKYGLYRQDYCGCVFSRRDGRPEETEKEL